MRRLWLIVLLVVAGLMIACVAKPSTAFLTFDFEDGTTAGWHTSEGEYKLAEVSVVDCPVKEGKALSVITDLRGNDEDTIYHHTEAKVYFDSSDLNGLYSRMWVYFPRDMLNHGGYVEFLHYVSDENSHNQYDARMRLDESMVDKWILLDLVVGAPEDTGHLDGGFDPQKIVGAGLRLEVYGEFAFAGTVTVIDNVQIGIQE